MAFHSSKSCASAPTPQAEAARTPALPLVLMLEAAVPSATSPATAAADDYPGAILNAMRLHECLDAVENAAPPMCDPGASR